MQDPKRAAEIAERFASSAVRLMTGVRAALRKAAREGLAARPEARAEFDRHRDRLTLAARMDPLALMDQAGAYLAEYHGQIYGGDWDFFLQQLDLGRAPGQLQPLIAMMRRLAENLTPAERERFQGYVVTMLDCYLEFHCSSS